MNIYYHQSGVTLHKGDALAVLKTLPDGSARCCVTSPPYWGLRDYGEPGQLGLEPTPDEYVGKMVTIFSEVRRVLSADGTLWLNLGDCYASDFKGSGGPSEKQLSNAGSFYNGSQRLIHGLKPKDLVGIPWRVAFALQADGWYLRSDIIWAKPNPMPESVTDRPTKAHEYIFLLSKSAKYYYDGDAIKDIAAGGRNLFGGAKHGFKGLDTSRNDGSRFDDRIVENRNKRSVWMVPTSPFPDAHFAVFPPDLIKPCILAGSAPGDVVLDPFIGAGTTAYVAKELNRGAIGIDLSEKYLAMAAKRLRQEVLPLAL